MQKTILIFVALIGLSALPVAAQQGVNDSLAFELDGNIGVNALSLTSTDWMSVNVSNGPISGAVRTGIKHDAAGSSVFTGGGLERYEPSRPVGAIVGCRSQQRRYLKCLCLCQSSQRSALNIFWRRSVLY